MKSHQQRVRAIELSLTPQQVVMVWLRNAQAGTFFPARTRRAIYLGIYFRHFESLDKTCGPLGAAINLYVWFYLSGFAILLGGEINFLLGDLRHQKTRQSSKPPTSNEQSEFRSLSLPLTYANRQSIQNLVSVRRRR
jgi:hypothetical protein